MILRPFSTSKQTFLVQYFLDFCEIFTKGLFHCYRDAKKILVEIEKLYFKKTFFFQIMGNRGNNDI